MGDLLAAWLLFPIAFAGLSLGVGLLVERASGIRLPGPLLLPAGFAGVVVAGHLTTGLSATAPLTTPVIVVLAAAGLALGLPGRLPRPDPAAAAAAVVTYGLYAAPIVLSGAATFAGYIKLDDTATWLAFTDHVIESGTDLGGLAPSTYEAALAVNIADGYPIGANVPLGVGHQLLLQDPAWLFQPYLSFMAALAALVLYYLLGGPLRSRALRAGVAIVATQAALTFAYVMWGGMKEIAATLLIALIAALVAPSFAGPPAMRRLVPLGIAVAALVSILSFGGGIWLLVAAGAAAALAASRWGVAKLLPAAATAAGLIVIGSLPLLTSGGILPPLASDLTGDALVHLYRPLEPAQMLGIWPAHDLRLDPADPAVAWFLIAVAGACAIVGLAYAVARRRESPGLLIYFATTALGVAVIAVLVSPWLEAKAFASAAPAFLLLAALGAATMIEHGYRAVGAIAAAAIVGGVLWSNALAYSGVNLAPREQLAELERIGEQIAGQGPTLMTEYQPYGARHFLREADPEAASELRRRQVALRDGGTLEKGEAADIDEIATPDVLLYRTLVLRRSPVGSRPPAPYQLVSSGRYYDVWQRPEGTEDVIGEHLPLGGDVDPLGTPDCDEVRSLAELAGDGGQVLAAHGTSPVAFALGDLPRTREWVEEGGFLTPEGEGAITAAVELDRPGAYEIWVGGSVRGELAVSVDGAPAGSIEHELNNVGQYILVGAAELEAGEHEIALSYSESPLRPGHGGDAEPLGPLVVTPADPRRSIEPVAAEDAAEQLCSRRWDWLAVLGG